MKLKHILALATILRRDCGGKRAGIPLCPTTDNYRIYHQRSNGCLDGDKYFAAFTYTLAPAIHRANIIVASMIIQDNQYGLQFQSNSGLESSPFTLSYTHSNTAYAATV